MRLAALILAGVGAVIATVPSPAPAQSGVAVYAESPADAMARNMRILATSPKSFEALVGAGKAALSLGDTQAAAGFFGRAEEVWPQSPLPQAGMGAALAHQGDTAGALRYFARAAELGATPVVFGADRGLVYDLMGQHGHAQADYRAAMSGTDHEEARRRLALSLAISGKKDEALGLLAPLMAKGDAAAARCRALILALNGDLVSARAALESRMPGSSHQMDPFFRRLPALSSAQKAAAVHLGIFPDSATQLAASTPAPVQESGDRLASIDGLLRQQPAAPAATQQPRIVSQVAAPPLAAAAAGASVSSNNVDAAKAAFPSRLWLQLASGKNPEALPQQFHSLKARHSEMFDGITGYVAEEPGRARLLIGPFRNSQEANIFQRDLETLRVNAFAWTNPAGQTIRKLP